MKKLYLTTTFFIILFMTNKLNAQSTHLLISTDLGDIKIMLYDDTPLHRDNFVKLATEGFYNGSVFHRVIQNFMIQGGGAPQGQLDKEYRIPAEILPNHIHKKGALAAARMGDMVNPQKESSGSQFYIVQGVKLTSDQVGMYESHIGKKFTAEQIEAYTTIGGTPHLDGEYTVFGEVVEGLDVVDKIAEVQTAAGDKPVKDVKMSIKVIEGR